MPALALSLGLPFYRRAALADPLAKLLLALRLQTHARQVDHYQDAILVTGAGEPKYNGLSFLSDSDHYRSSDLDRVIYRDSGDTWTLDAASAPVRFGYRSVPGGSFGDPQDTTYTAAGSAATPPPPTINKVRVPFYKTVGLFKDIACTIRATQDGDSVAAWRDEWYFKLTGLFRGAIQANPMKQPKLRFFNGIPVLAFDGIDDALIYQPLAGTPPMRQSIISVGYKSAGGAGGSPLAGGRILTSPLTGENWLVGTWEGSVGVNYAEGWTNQSNIGGISDTWHITSSKLEDTTTRCFHDGQDVTQDNAPNGTPTVLAVGGNYTGEGSPGEFCNGSVTSVTVALPPLMNVTELQAILSTLNP